MTAWFGVAIITTIGYGAIRLAGLHPERLESLALGWLLGSFLVTSTLFWWGWVGAWSLILVSAMIFTIWWVRKLEGTTQHRASLALEGISFSSHSPSFLSKTFTVFVWLLTFSQLFYALFCVLWLTSQYWDTYHFWHFRAKYFFVEGSLGLEDDPAWMFGGEKIHYPIHLPLLKALLCRLAGGWSDSWALGVDLINFVAFLIIVYLFVKRISTHIVATITIYLITSLPLLGIHLSAGFGDLTVAVYLGSAVIFWERWRYWGKMYDLAISGFLIAAAAWTKNDALALYIPVIFIATALAGTWRANKVYMTAIIVPLLPWFIFKMIMGLAYNPNPTSHIFEFHPEALLLSLKVLFSFGSFGILWILLIPLLFWKCKPNVSRALWPMAWGCIIMVLSVYVFTENFRFLIIGTTFSRSLLQVAPLLIIAMVLRIMDIINGEQKMVRRDGN